MLELQLLPKLVELARQAGAVILDIYAKGYTVSEKADHSPLTEADMASHNVIAAGLAVLSPLPLLSEESAGIDWTERQTWERYWLVDPLDGTKEFIARNGEFTVNIALIAEGRPVLGVVYAPVLQRAYFAAAGMGAFRQDGDLAPQPIRVADVSAGEGWRVVASRSHSSSAEQQFLGDLGDVSLVSMGSSLKFCLVAEGAAHLYPRFGLTSEWDTAAAQCVVEQAGGAVLTDVLVPLIYNSKESLLNPHFIVCNTLSEAWAAAYRAARQS